MHKRLTVALLLAVLVALAAAIPVLAYTYRAAYTITENGTAGWTMLPVMVDSSNQFMVDNGFMGSTAMDTRVETLGGLAKPHMVTDNRTLTAVAVPKSSQTNLYFTTGSSNLTAMDIVLGRGGYITTSDNATMPEATANFSYEISAYIDTSASMAGENISSKTDAIRVFVGAPGVIAATTNATTYVAQSTQDTTWNMSSNATDYQRVGERIDTFPISTVLSVSFLLKKTGSPTGILSATLRTVTGDTLLGTFGTLDASTISTSATFYTFYTFVPNTVTQNVRFQAEYSGGDTSNCVVFHGINANLIAGSWTGYQAGYSDSALYDAAIRLAYVTSTNRLVSWSGVSSNETTVVVAGGSSNNLTLTINGILRDSIAWSGSSVPNNTATWQDGGVVVPYWNYIKRYKGGNLVQRFEPNDMIIGTTMPDRSVVNNNGVIAWGANPTGVNVTLGSMVSSGQPGVGTVAGGVPRDVLPPAQASDWFKDPAISTTLRHHPLRPLVRLLSDYHDPKNTTPITELQAWRFFGLIFVLLVTVSVAVKTRGHYFITGVVCGCAIGALVAQTIWPLWTLVFAVMAVIGGLISERSPSL